MHSFVFASADALLTVARHAIVDRTPTIASTLPRANAA
jgi:hypothetical protein